MKSGKRNVMFIHQTLPDSASPSDGTTSNTIGSTKKRGRPRKMKLMDHPHQTIAATPGTSSSVIKEAISCTSSNGSGMHMEEACASPTPLQIDLSPNRDEQSSTEITAGEPTVKDSKSILDHLGLGNVQSRLPSIVPATVKKNRMRRSSKSSYGEQVKGVEGEYPEICQIIHDICMYIV